MLMSLLTYCPLSPRTQVLKPHANWSRVAVTLILGTTDLTTIRMPTESMWFCATVLCNCAHVMAEINALSVSDTHV